MGRYAKAIVAIVLAGITAAQAIWVDNNVLTVLGAVVTAIGVYLVPNTPDATIVR